MANEFNPTHEITVTSLDGSKTESKLVQLVDGAAYTREEWDACDSADWEYAEETGWTFQGRSAPNGNCTVSVRALA
ncbi:MAG TPA: hypothetical protein VIM73_03040 [Polyangiaceae bacterium]